MPGLCKPAALCMLCLGFTAGVGFHNTLRKPAFGNKEGAVNLLKRDTTQIINTPKTTCNGGMPAVQEVVMGMATGYSWQQMSTFILSLRSNGYAGDIVLGVKPSMDSFTRRNFDDNCVKGVAVKLDTNYLPKMPGEWAPSAHVYFAILTRRISCATTFSRIAQVHRICALARRLGLQTGHASPRD